MKVKHDGFRTLARKQGARVEVWSRFGTDFTARFSNIAEAVRGLPAESVLIDGEAVAFLPGGHSDFGALRTKAGGACASFVAFDLLSLEGEDLRANVLSRSGERRSCGSYTASTASSLAHRSPTTARPCSPKPASWGLEGIVSKRAGSRYKSGPSRNWLKCLSPEFQRR